MKRNGTPTDNIEYSEICKAIRRKMKEDIRKHDEKQIIEAIGEKQKSETSKTEAVLRERPTHFYYGRRWDSTFMIKTE